MKSFLISLVVVNIIITFCDYYFVKRKAKKISEIEYLKIKHKKKISRKNNKRNSIIIAISNGFIISFVSNFVYYLRISYFVAFPLAFILLLSLIYIIYNYIIIRVIK